MKKNHQKKAIFLVVFTKHVEHIMTNVLHVFCAHNRCGELLHIGNGTIGIGKKSL